MAETLKQVQKRLLESFEDKYDEKYSTKGLSKTGSKGFWKRYEKENRVLATQGKHKGKYINRKTGKLWDRTKERAEMRSDINSIKELSKPFSDLNIAQRKLKGHIKHQDSPVAQVRRLKSGKTDVGGSAFDFEQGIIQTELEQNVQQALNQLRIKPFKRLNQEENLSDDREVVGDPSGTSKDPWAVENLPNQLVAYQSGDNIVRKGQRGFEFQRDAITQDSTEVVKEVKDRKPNDKKKKLQIDPAKKKRFEQVFGKNRSDRFRRNMLMSQAFMDM